MDMKKILQAMDGVASKPVEGADSMAKFLRVVKEADLNKSISETVEYLPPDPEISAQLRAQGDAAMEADRPKHQANAFIRYSSGLYKMSMLPQTINIKPGVTLPVRFNPIKNMDGDVLANATAANKLLPPELQYSSDELLQVVGQKPMQETTAPVPAVTPIKVPPIPQLPAQDGDLGAGVKVTTNADGTRTYSSGIGRFTYNAQGKAIKYDEPQFTGLGRSIDLTTGQTTQNYNAGPLNTTQTTDAKGNVVSHNTEYDVGVGKMAMGRDAKGITSKSWQGRGEEAQDVVSNKDLYAMGNKDKEATYDRAMAQANATPVQENSLSKFLSIVDKNNVSMLSEGTNPHRVALPVQMAMQHYQQVKETPQPRERLIDKYFVEAETEIMQRREEKRALINQYAKTIAERVLMKESAQHVSEAPIEMTGDANDPHIYGHQKANPMSLKGRIGQARAQLKELAELAESDSLLAWEQICKKAKGGMFMGLEQNLEQIRHGIEELAKQRRKGGTASRGIDKHIGEGKRK